MRKCLLDVSPFKLVQMTECQIYKGVNVHATARFQGIIPNQMEEKYLAMAQDSAEATITATSSCGEENILFRGMIQTFSIKRENGLKIACGELISGTYAMDHKPHTRTFQDKTLTYQDVMGICMEEYPKGRVAMTVGQGKPIGDWILQYHETDWEFAKRLASHFHSFLVPDCKAGGATYFFGMPEPSDPVTVSPAHCSTRKRVGEYLYKKANAVPGIQEKDAVYYIFDSGELHDIGDMVQMDGQQLYLFESNSNLRGSKMVHHYALKRKNGFQTITRCNERAAGASLAANILDVKKDRVQIAVQSDENKGRCGAKWFRFFTAHSSPDNLGRDMRPEIGDEVHLHLPVGNEHSSYVISSGRQKISSVRGMPKIQLQLIYYEAAVKQK